MILNLSHFAMHHKRYFRKINQEETYEPFNVNGIIDFDLK